MVNEATPHPEFDRDALTAYRWIVEQGLLDPDHELGGDFIAAGRTQAVTSELLLNLYPYSESTIASSGPDGDAVASVFTPHEPTDSLRAAIVWIHVGGMFGGDRFQAMEALILAEQQGMVVVSVEYRRPRESISRSGGRQLGCSARSGVTIRVAGNRSTPSLPRRSKRRWGDCRGHGPPRSRRRWTGACRDRASMSDAG